MNNTFEGIADAPLTYYRLVVDASKCSQRSWAVLRISGRGYSRGHTLRACFAFSGSWPP